MVGWYHRLNGRGFGWTLGVGDGQGGLVCCGSWCCRVGHDWATELNWTELNWWWPPLWNFPFFLILESLRLLISVGHEFEQAPGDGEGQGSLVCCSPGGHKESDMTEQLNNNYPVSTVVMFLQNTRINRCVPCLPGKWTVRLFPGLINCKSFHWFNESWVEGAGGREGKIAAHEIYV